MQADLIMRAAPAVARPSLLADIGGTNARFALQTAPGQFDCVRVLPCAGYASLQDAMRAYLAEPAVAAHGTPREAAMAVANPVDGDQIRMTNHHWQFYVITAEYPCFPGVAAWLRDTPVPAAV